MAIFGEKCVRCGERRTRHEFEGLPTCEPCENEIRARGRAAEESPRSCPIDGQPMEKDVVLNVVIDRCTRCKGVWLDGGELELIRNAVAEGVSMDLARAVTFPF
jgi:hypothetical protein